MRRSSRQLADPQLAELDRRALGLEAEVPGARLAAAAAGDLLAVDPEPDLAVDAADVIVVPLADALAQLLPGGKLRLPSGETGGKGVIFDVPTGKTSPLVVNQSAFLPDCFSYCSV